MKEINRSRLSAAFRISCYVCLFLLVAYVLSIGPVVGSIQTPEGTPLQYVAPLTIFYAPLMWVIDRSNFLEEVVRRYIAFCSPDF